MTRLILPGQDTGTRNRVNDESGLPDISEYLRDTCDKWYMNNIRITAGYEF